MSDEVTLNQLRDSLKARGIRAELRSDQMMMVSETPNPLPDTENSFIVQHAGGKWYIQTWAPRVYEIPESADVLECCLACFASSKAAMWRVLQDLAYRFQLRLLDDDEMERLFETT